jgi:hypothetical protein
MNILLLHTEVKFGLWQWRLLKSSKMTTLCGGWEFTEVSKDGIAFIRTAKQVIAIFFLKLHSRRRRQHDTSKPREVDCVWNVMAHAQKPDFFFRQNGLVHLNRRGASVQSNTVSRGVRISGINARYTMFRGTVKSTGYPLHSPVPLSLPLPCVTVCHHISTGLYSPNGTASHVFSYSAVRTTNGVCKKH